jgi:transposase
MNQKYTGKEEFLKRIKKPECPSIKVLSEELNIPKATLYAWIHSERKTKSEPGMKKKTTTRSPIKKFALLAESDGLKGSELQAFCEKNGVSLEELMSWKDLALGAIEHSESGAVISKKEYEKAIARQEKELKRKTDALAEMAALLVLQKKTLGLFGDER